MNFCWVTLPVKDLDASLAFYNDVLGLPIHSKHSGNGIKMAMLGEENQSKIELISMPENQNKTLHSDISIGIAVESMDSAIQLLKTKGIPIARGPVSPGPNIHFLFVLDPDGYEVQLVETREQYNHS